MSFYIFDFDGTLAEISHRRHHLDGAAPQWAKFFEDCDKDAPIKGVIAVLLDLVAQGHRVEIWSGRSADVEEKSRRWLDDVGVPSCLLKRMRPSGDFTPDDKLKRDWLKEERALGNEPTVIFDDRQKVVEMWRAEGVECFQVNPGDFDAPASVNPHKVYTKHGFPILTMLIGPSGAGKSTLADRLFDPQTVISSDRVRSFLCGDSEDQSRNAAVWRSIAMVVKARLLAGLPTVLDAINVKTKDRTEIAKLTPAGMTCAYLIVQRPLVEMLATGGERLKSVDKAGLNQIERHERIFRANLKSIRAGDNLPFVRVFETADSYADFWDVCEASALVDQPSESQAA